MVDATRKAVPKHWGIPTKGISNVYISRITVGVAEKGISFINR
jgi:hypothetical protein